MATYNVNDLDLLNLFRRGYEQGAKKEHDRIVAAINKHHFFGESAYSHLSCPLCKVLDDIKKEEHE